MSVTTAPDPCQLLREADAAWHQMALGGAIRRVVDENGESVEYSMANRAGLLAYIRQLQAQCADYQALSLGTNRTNKFWF